MGHKVRKEGQAKGTGSVFNRITPEMFSNLEKDISSRVQEASRASNRYDQNRTSPWHIIIKITRIKNKERILNIVREKNQITYKDKPITKTAVFSTETLKTRRA
jgi:hypothetical protein